MSRTQPQRSAIVSRRDALRGTALGFGALAAASLIATEEARGEATGRPRNVRPRADHVIFLFMKGGPSHVDTFDYKPRLQRDHGKPLPFAKPRVQFAPTSNLLASPWSFSPCGESGIPVSELFPNVARHVDDLCIINSVHGTNAAHGGASLKLHTGSDTFVRPSLGAWVSYGLGSAHRDLPSFVTICPTLAHGGVNNWGAAFLPAEHQGTPLGVASRPATTAKLGHIDNPRLSRAAQRRQLDFLAASHREHLERTSTESDELEARIESFELAFRMQRAMPEAQDLSRETPATQRLYGLDDPRTEDFGRQCLMARRLVERGVRFVQVTHSDSNVQWDQHGDLRKGHSKNAREVDRPIAGLLADLRSRGLLERTLVIWGGEFGRTPTVQGAGNDGRDHNPEGFTVWLAGGGTRGGQRVGATDEYGYYAVENRVHVHDLHATILWILGLDHETLTFRHGGRDFRLTDVAGRVVDDVLA